ncbi:MAG TPA: hypothetical protein VMF61_04955 [Candidatus Acidoferrales bacterium]|nr:hypothetical protein [Candidatus Acidoferrales bacterium]
MYLQPLEGTLAQASFPPIAEPGDGGALPLPEPGFPPGLGSDGISRMLPPFYGAGGLPSPLQSGMFGPLAGLMQQLVQMLQAFMGYGSSPLGGGTYPQPYEPEQYFANAGGGSEGDPHLSFNGNRWTSMQSQPSLLQSNSIPGGFQISTQVTPPTAQGVSWNQSATVTLDGGATSITMNEGGQPSIVSGGQAQTIAPGQTLQLGNGQSVSCNQNGSLRVVAANGLGGEISTTLAARARGVDVDVSAQNVDLGGALVDRSSGLGATRPPY